MFGFFEKKQPVVHTVTAHDLLLTVGQEIYQELGVLETMDTKNAPKLKISHKTHRKVCIENIRKLLMSAGIFEKGRIV